MVKASFEFLSDILFVIFMTLIPDLAMADDPKPGPSTCPDTSVKAVLDKAESGPALTPKEEAIQMIKVGSLAYPLVVPVEKALPPIPFPENATEEQRKEIMAKFKAEHSDEILAVKRIQKMNIERFNREVLDEKRPVVILMTAPEYCGPCRAFDPKLDAIIQSEMLKAGFTSSEIEKMKNEWKTNLPRDSKGRYEVSPKRDQLNPELKAKFDKMRVKFVVFNVGTDEESQAVSPILKAFGNPNLPTIIGYDADKSKAPRNHTELASEAIDLEMKRLETSK